MVASMRKAVKLDRSILATRPVVLRHCGIAASLTLPVVYNRVGLGPSMRGAIEPNWSILECAGHGRLTLAIAELQLPSPSRLRTTTTASSLTAMRTRYTGSSTLSLARAC